MLRTTNKLLEYKWFPVSFRILTLIAFIGLVIIGFSSPTKDPFFQSQLSKTNMTTSFVWRLWWPLIVLSAIFVGRFWCMICPVELVTVIFAKIGFKLKQPRWILSGWIITLFYMVVLIVGVTILKIDLNPEYTSYYLLFIMGMAVASGLIFEKNTFCRYVCPVGYLLGIFSKMSIWGWRVKNESVCSTCPDKSCISSRYTYQLNYKSCGVDLVPAEINDNSHCLLCAGCLKTCKTYKTGNNSSRPNPAIVKTGFANDLMQVRPLKPAEWFFLFFLTGSMIFEMTHFRVISDISASLFPKNISAGLGLTGGIRKNLAEVTYLFILLPMLIWILPFMLIRPFGASISPGIYMKKISLVFIPVIAAFFAGLSIMEIATKFPYYRYIIKDIRGVETTKAFLFRQIEMPQLPYWIELTFILILMSSLAAGVFISFKVIRNLMIKSDLQGKSAVLYVLPLIFIFMLVSETFMFLCF
jgi:polyferredoxin